MADGDYVNSNDLTQDDESMSEVKGNPFCLSEQSEIDSSSRENSYNSNQLSMTVENVHSTSGVKMSLSVYGNDLRNKNPYKMGGVFSFLFINGEPKIVIGPQYFMSIFLFIIINLINALLMFFVYRELFFIMKLIGVLIYIVQVTSQVLSTLINPGIPHRNNYLSESIMHMIYQNIKFNNYKFDKYRVCKICNILVNVEQEVTHCEECNICVEDLDHHCVWLGKCIAKRNLTLFNTFVMSTAAFGIYSVISLVALVIVKVSHSL